MPDTTILLRDGNNNVLTMKGKVGPDGRTQFYHGSDADITLPDNAAVGMVGTTMSKFSDGFSGPTLTAGAATLTALAEKWNVVRNTGGMTIQELNGALVVTTGTAVAEFLMVGKGTCTIPQNLIAVLSMTARSANQEIRVGYVEVDPATGLPIANPNLANFFTNHCAVLFNGTVNTTAVLETLSGSNPSTKTVTIGSQTASTSVVEYALEVRPEDVTYQQAVADSVVPKVLTAGRISSMVPSPNVVYAPFLWVRNTGTATSNAITLQRIISMDIQELQVEVGGGRGNTASSQAIPVVQVASGTTQNVTVASALPAGGNNIGGVVVVNSSVATTGNNAAAPVKINSAATNNLTLIKATAGKLWGGYIHNAGTTRAYLRLFNATSTAGVTMGTTAPVVILPIPADGFINIASIVDQYGLNFGTGIVYAITAGPTDLDNTPLAAANEVVGTLLYV